MKKLPLLILIFISLTAQGQTMPPVFNFPTDLLWNIIEEGDTMTFQLSIDDNVDTLEYRYSVYGQEELSLELDSAGNFTWVPSYDLVDRVQDRKEYSVIFEAISPTDEKIRKEISFIVRHKNRHPIIGELPVFYIRQYAENEFNLKQLDQIKDPDGDPVVFKPVFIQMPEGATLSELGIFQWKPSRTQFNNLRKEPLEVTFIVQDQPEKAEVEGTFIVAPTQLDLPPEIMMVPSDTLFVLKEDEVLNLNFYISDPNGDENLKDVSFVTNDLRVPKDALKMNTATQWEFTWIPGYDFVQEEDEAEILEVVVFALDETNKRAEKKVNVRIEDTENLDQKDKRLYHEYRELLLQTMDLIAHLDENQRALNKQLKKAEKGKRNRSIINASLGAITGVSPVFLENESKDYVTGIGGTAVLTLGTLEATEVMGRSKDDIMERLKINIDIRNQLQQEGDQFARKYALKSQRRQKDYHTDVDKLKAQLNNKKMILLELDASWQNPAKPTDRNIKRQFPDFNNEGFEGDGRSDLN